MSKFKPPPIPAGASYADPRTREKMATWIREFHQEQVTAIGGNEMLRIYCQALNNWVLNPTTNSHDIELLVDEICHTARLEDSDS